MITITEDRLREIITNAHMSGQNIVGFNPNYMHARSYFYTERESLISGIKNSEDESSPVTGISKLEAKILWDEGKKLGAVKLINGHLRSLKASKDYCEKVFGGNSISVPADNQLRGGSDE
jgi:hypothetical protein